MLYEKEEQFAQALVAKLPTYALGRSLEFTDEERIGELAPDFKKQKYRLDLLIESMVASDLFRTR